VSGLWFSLSVADPVPILLSGLLKPPPAVVSSRANPPFDAWFGLYGIGDGGAPEFP
jgi:hypothetical protein